MLYPKNDGLLALPRLVELLLLLDPSSLFLQLAQLLILLHILQHRRSGSESGKNHSGSGRLRI